MSHKIRLNLSFPENPGKLTFLYMYCIFAELL